MLISIKLVEMTSNEKESINKKDMLHQKMHTKTHRSENPRLSLKILDLPQINHEMIAYYHFLLLLMQN